MNDNPRLRQLLDELLDSHATPEDVCRSCPEFLPEVRARWRAVCHVRAELDALFPAPTVRGGGAPAPRPEGGALPQVPGHHAEALLGQGGMGVVYRAWHLRLHRPVALKMVLAGAHAQPAERERLLREAEAVAGLSHPNIVQVYEVGDVDGRPYFTMEFVEGGSLAQKLAGTPQPGAAPVPEEGPARVPR
jgi:serine/threonine-protein kinase